MKLGLALASVVLASLGCAAPQEEGSVSGDEADLTVTPDDYRQVELVPLSKMDAVEAEFADVRRVLKEHREGASFDEIHVRKRVAEPLEGHFITRAEIEAAMGARGRPLGLRGQRGVVKGGFAIPYADGMVYGVERDGALGDGGGLAHGDLLAISLGVGPRPRPRTHSSVVVVPGRAYAAARLMSQNACGS